ncbi:mannose-6-phosphate isomerase [bacterium 1XD21-13]|nr:mannose-6-phosphate isomerase [bacterium 1XD21-13]
MKKQGPVKLKPVRKTYLWGTEDWMLSWLNEGLKEIPLLIKIIRARDALSVQVHPQDALAWELEQGTGKTEMWYVLDCEPGACLYYGLKHQISVNEFRKRIDNGSLLEVCRSVPVKKGDVFYIPAGLIHAIGKGITVAEVQQSSNITYRVYDYNREDANHQRRELHIEKALRAASFMPPLAGHHPMGPRIRKIGYSKTLLVQCPYFVVQLYEIEECMEGAVEDSFQSLLILEGEGSLRSVCGDLAVGQGDSILLPKGMGAYQLIGRLQILISEV